MSLLLTPSPATHQRGVARRIHMHGDVVDVAAVDGADWAKAMAAFTRGVEALLELTVLSHIDLQTVSPA